MKELYISLEYAKYFENFERLLLHFAKEQTKNKILKKTRAV